MLWRRFQQVKIISCFFRYLVILYTRTCACYSHRGLDVSLRKGNASCVLAKPVLPLTHSPPLSLSLSLSAEASVGLKLEKSNRAVDDGKRKSREPLLLSLLFPSSFARFLFPSSQPPYDTKGPLRRKEIFRAIYTRKNKTRLSLDAS